MLWIWPLKKCCKKVEKISLGDTSGLVIMYAGERKRWGYYYSRTTKMPRILLRLYLHQKASIRKHCSKYYAKRMAWSLAAASNNWKDLPRRSSRFLRGSRPGRGHG